MRAWVVALLVACLFAVGSAWGQSDEPVGADASGVLVSGWVGSEGFTIGAEVALIKKADPLRPYAGLFAVVSTDYGDALWGLDLGGHVVLGEESGLFVGGGVFGGMSFSFSDEDDSYWTEEEDDTNFMYGFYPEIGVLFRRGDGDQLAISVRNVHTRGDIDSDMWMITVGIIGF